MGYILGWDVTQADWEPEGVGEERGCLRGGSIFQGAVTTPPGDKRRSQQHDVISPSQQFRSTGTSTSTLSEEKLSKGGSKLGPTQIWLTADPRYPVVNPYDLCVVKYS